MNADLFCESNRYSENNMEHIVIETFCKFLTRKGYHITLLTFPILKPNLVSETVDAPLWAKYRKVISFTNADGKLISMLQKYELTSYVERRERGHLDLTLNFPDALTNLNILLGSEL